MQIISLAKTDTIGWVTGRTSSL